LHAVSADFCKGLLISSWVRQERQTLRRFGLKFVPTLSPILLTQLLAIPRSKLPAVLRFLGFKVSTIPNESILKKLGTPNTLFQFTYIARRPDLRVSEVGNANLKDFAIAAKVRQPSRKKRNFYRQYWINEVFKSFGFKKTNDNKKDLDAIKIITKNFSKNLAAQIAIIHKNEATINNPRFFGGLLPGNVSILGEILDLDTFCFPHTLNPEEFKRQRQRDLENAFLTIGLFSQRLLGDYISIDWEDQRDWKKYVLMAENIRSIADNSFKEIYSTITQNQPDKLFLPEIFNTKRLLELMEGPGA